MVKKGSKQRGERSRHEKWDHSDSDEEKREQAKSALKKKPLPSAEPHDAKHEETQVNHHLEALKLKDLATEDDREKALQDGEEEDARNESGLAAVELQDTEVNPEAAETEEGHIEGAEDSPEDDREVKKKKGSKKTAKIPVCNESQSCELLDCWH